MLGRTLCGEVGAVPDTAVGRVGMMDAVGVVEMQGEGCLQGNPRWAAGLKGDCCCIAGGIAEGIAGEEGALEKVCGRGRGRVAGEKRRPGCPTSLPSVCTCNIKNGVISDTSR